MDTARHALTLVALFALALHAAPAGAQTLTVELDGSLELEAPRYVAPAYVAPAAPAIGAVVVVRPPDAHDDRAPAYVTPSEVPTTSTYAIPRAVAHPGTPEDPNPAPTTEEESELEMSVWLGAFAEGGDLLPGDLTFQAPEIEALGGLRLDQDWAGMNALREQLSGGLAFGVGMRAHGYLRGPEVRFFLGGGDLAGTFERAPGDSGLALAMTSVFALRAELAMGLQLPLGPVIPYVLARAAVGGIFVTTEVRHAELGSLGTETLEQTIGELGMEAGVGIQLGDGLELGMAFRGSFLGTETLGGMVTLGVHE